MWEPSEYEYVRSIIVDHREIWHPDIMAFNKYVPILDIRILLLMSKNNIKKTNKQTYKTNIT